MCGRFTFRYYWKQLHKLLELTTPPALLPIRYNVAPTQSAPIVRADTRGDGTIGEGGARALAMLRWGLIPSWAKDAKIGGSTINARAEGIETKPAFRAAFKRRRCIVPVSGFYEWKRLAGMSEGDEGGVGGEGRRDGGKGARGAKRAPTKQPYYITAAADDEPLAFAGLWEWWNPPANDGPEGEPVETFTIITTTPNELMAGLHDRMPVILDRADFDRWLDPANSDAASLLALLRPCPSELLRCWPVSTRVNSPRFEDPSCIERVEPAPKAGSVAEAGTDASAMPASPSESDPQENAPSDLGSARPLPDSETKRPRKPRSKPASEDQGGLWPNSP